MPELDNITIIIAIAAVLVIGVVVALVLKRGKTKTVVEAPPTTEEIAQPEEEGKPGPLLAPAPTDLDHGLAKTRGVFGRLNKFFGRSSKDTLGDREWAEVEEALIEGDVGVKTSGLLLESVKGKLKTSNGRPLRELIQEAGEALLSGISHGMPDLDALPKPYVISIVGVNGVGKTTTIGKLAHHFQRNGRKVLMAAGDTFRAAAISQLRVWSERSGAQFVSGREGGDPGAVAFDSLTAAKARGIDVVLLDTAGRLHTKSNLMDELKKVHRVMKKVIPEAPHETWLIVDGTLGQNSIVQAREFSKEIELTGLVVTKLDGTSKGGALLAIAHELKLPIRFIGIGEAIEDLIPFEPKPFVGAILGTA